MLKNLKKILGINNHILPPPMEEVKMKIKITKDEPTPFSNYGKSDTTTTVKKSPIYIMIYSKTGKPITNKSLKFLGNSRKTGYPLYEVLDKTILDSLNYNKITYKEIIMTNGDVSSFAN